MAATPAARAFRTLLLSLALSAAGLVAVALAFGSLSDVLRVLALPLPTLAAALAVLAVQLLAGGLRLMILLRLNRVRLSLVRNIRAVILGFFAAAVTPSGGGNAPAIALSLIRDGVAAPLAWSVTIYTSVVDLLFFSWAVPVGIGVVWVGIGFPGAVVLAAGALTSLVCLALYGALAFRPEWLERVLTRLVGLPFLRRYYRTLRRAFTGVTASIRHTSAASLDRQVLLQAVTACAHLAAALIFWVIARGMGSELEVWSSVALVMLASMSANLVPTPGGSGYFEFAVSYLFAGRMAAGLLTPTVLAWRALSFYVVVLLGAVLGGTMLAAALGDRRADEVPNEVPSEP